MKPLYTARASATGGRDGYVRSDDGILEFDLAMPKELGGPGGQYWTLAEALYECEFGEPAHGKIKRYLDTELRPARTID